MITFEQTISEALTVAFQRANDHYVRGVTFVVSRIGCTALEALPGWYNELWQTKEMKWWTCDSVKKRGTAICQPMINATLDKVPLDPSWKVAASRLCREVRVEITLSGDISVHVDMYYLKSPDTLDGQGTAGGAH